MVKLHFYEALKLTNPNKYNFVCKINFKQQVEVIGYYDMN